MTPEHERWAEAAAVLRQHGDEVDVFIAARIDTLTAASDSAGVARWQQIAWRVQHLQEACAAARQ